MRESKLSIPSAIILTGIFMVGGLVLAVSGPINSLVTIGNAVPTVTSVNLNGGGASIILTANTTKAISVSAIISDNNGCTDIQNGTETIVLYRTAAGSGCTASNRSCYTASAFTASSTCTTTSVNTTTTFNLQYFADATDASSSFSSDSWTATINFTDPAGATSTASSATTSLLTLNAINITTSSIAYGTQAASSTTGATNQTTTVANAGNSSTSLNISGTEFKSGSNQFATTSQHYATSSFTFGNGSDTALTDSAVSVAGFLLTSPTSTTNVSQNLFWGLTVPAGTATGSYTATTTFTAVFHT